MTTFAKRLHMAAARRLRALLNPPMLYLESVVTGEHTRIDHGAYVRAARLELRDYAQIGANGLIVADQIILGKGAVIEDGVTIRCRQLVLGDGGIIRSGTRIEMSELVVGDYTVINQNCLLSGTRWCWIGHNCWIGHYSVIDSIGTTRIGNGVGVGAHSQLWTHIYFGDIWHGSRFASHKALVIDDDVWFVGHCIVSPIHAAAQSMAMVGSVVTRDMVANHVYAGVPAVDMTERLGSAYENRSVEAKRDDMNRHLQQFLQERQPRENRIRIVDRIDVSTRGVSQFGVVDRQYLKRGFAEEVEFVRYLLPTKAKFTPHPSTDWVNAIGLAVTA